MKNIFSLEKAKELTGKRVLVRVDFNVPLKQGQIAKGGDTRLKLALETIKYLVSKKAKVILLSHLGRPGGQVQEELRLKPIAEHLSGILGQPVVSLRDCTGVTVEQVIERLHGGEVIMLENLRFYPGEEKNDKKFASALAKFGDLYVNEAFSVSHRRAASVVELAEELPSYGGFQFLREIKELSFIRENPPHPLVVIMGGAKLSSKFGLVKYFLKEADQVLVGGGIANTLLAAAGVKIGNSLFEAGFLKEAKVLLKLGGVGTEKPRLLLPLDVVVRDGENHVREVQVGAENIKINEEIGDIGLRTRRLFAESLRGARLVVWNGPVGILEDERLAVGTMGLVRVVADLPKDKTKTVVGGGETVEALEQLGVREKIGFVSTGGGAMLEFLQGKRLPGIEALKR